MLEPIRILFLSLRLSLEGSRTHDVTSIIRNGAISSLISDYWWIPAVLGGVLIGLVLFFFLRKNKTRSPQFDTKDIDRLASLFGGFDNIVKAELDGQRLKVVVKSVTTADLEGLRTMGGQGLFVTGNQIKLTMATTPSAFVDAIKKAREN